MVVQLCNKTTMCCDCNVIMHNSSCNERFTINCSTDKNVHVPAVVEAPINEDSVDEKLELVCSDGRLQPV